jgi:hypothetical protein
VSFPQGLAEKTSFENGLPDHYLPGQSIKIEQLGEMIMSSIARAAGVASGWNGAFSDDASPPTYRIPALH